MKENNPPTLELKPLTKDELHELNTLIDRLDNEISLESKTTSDIRLSIYECFYRRCNKHL